MKKNVIIIFIILLVAMVFGLYFKNNSNDEKNMNNVDNTYYTINIPNNWIAKNISQYETDYFINGKKVASITVINDCSFCSTTSSIITNWLGMHARAKGEIKEKKRKGYRLAKLNITYEQSAAEQIENKSSLPDELHYFFINNENTFIDFVVYNKELIKLSTDKIAESLTYK